jgi:hypothetical protein
MLVLDTAASSWQYRLQTSQRPCRCMGNGTFFEHAQLLVHVDVVDFLFSCAAVAALALFAVTQVQPSLLGSGSRVKLLAPGIADTRTLARRSVPGGRTRKSRVPHCMAEPSVASSAGQSCQGKQGTPYFRRTKSTKREPPAFVPSSLPDASEGSLLRLRGNVWLSQVEKMSRKHTPISSYGRFSPT